jgi:hypothetical protein
MINFKSPLVILIVFISACNSGPKVITATENGDISEKSSGIFSETPSAQPNMSANQPMSDDLHTVTVNEVLTTSKYNYINVNEGTEQFWIAAKKQNVVVGETYFYKGGLLKTNYESKEHNRLFSKIYLVTNMVGSDHANQTGMVKQASTTTADQVPSAASTPKEVRVIEQEGSIKIAELVKHPEKYDGKTIQVSGVCVKINPNIMNRNWLHLTDGSQDDYDLTITSDEFVTEGTVITMQATVALNKDFGAGYRYDLILENGVLIK